MRSLTIVAVLTFFWLSAAQAEVSVKSDVESCMPASDLNRVDADSTSAFSASSDAWRNTISTLVAEPLWNDRDAYDAAHVLMVPLHYAFVSQDHAAISEFEALMGRFAMQELTGGQLQMAQWMYFVSRYLALRIEFNRPLRQIDVVLAQRVAAWLHVRWEYEPGFSWGRPPLIGTKARIAYINSNPKPWPLSYYPAITDYELFLFATASDIKQVLRVDADIIERSKNAIRNSIDEMISTGIEVVRTRGSFNKTGGWLFQIGIWSDHPDFRFAGHMALGPELSEARLPQISEDSSHSHRWPLFFRSLIAAAPKGSQEEKDLVDAYVGFSRQFLNEVVKLTADGVLLSNYMNGHNGIYRYRYSTIGKNRQLGYGAYALSGILGESWYPFAIDVELIFDAYAESYPLKKKILDLYVGPNTTRPRNPLFAWPNFFTDGLAEMIAKQARYLASHYRFHKKEHCI